MYVYNLLGPLLRRSLHFILDTVSAGSPVFYADSNRVRDHGPRVTDVDNEEERDNVVGKEMIYKIQNNTELKFYKLTDY